MSPARHRPIAPSPSQTSTPAAPTLSAVISATRRGQILRPQEGISTPASQRKQPATIVSTCNCAGEGLPEPGRQG